MELLGLGRDRLTVRVAGSELELSPRRSELVAVLVLSSQGLSAEELARRLYGDARRAVTVRAEVCRLRAQLGPILAANPYRLLADVRDDFLAPALPPEAGELLPSAQAPVVVAQRRRLRERGSGSRASTAPPASPAG